MATTTISITTTTAPHHRAVGALRAFYEAGTERAALAATAVALLYGCGAAMFWVHAVHRAEQGPPIADVYHWLLDSTLGFVALTPVVALLIPLATRALGATGVGDRGLPILRYSLLVGFAFALVTAPGPFLHDAVAGAGTPLAELATNALGSDPDVVARAAHAHGHSPVEEGAVQLIVGLPLYSLAVLLVTAAMRARRGPGAAREAARHRYSMAAPAPSGSR